MGGCIRFAATPTARPDKHLGWHGGHHHPFTALQHVAFAWMFHNRTAVRAVVGFCAFIHALSIMNRRAITCSLRKGSAPTALVPPAVDPCFTNPFVFWKSKPSLGQSRFAAPTSSRPCCGGVVANKRSGAVARRVCRLRRRRSPSRRGPDGPPAYARGEDGHACDWYSAKLRFVQCQAACLGPRAKGP